MIVEFANSSLSDVVKTAWKAGSEIDLQGVGYGRLHWGNKTDVRDEPSPYYYFLAGLVRTYRFSRILEIGTHWGGATRAMWRGLNAPHQSKIVTVDITTESDARLLDFPDIVKIVGDGNSKDVVTRVAAEFGAVPVDLVYIDAAHQSMATLASVIAHPLNHRLSI